MTKRSLLVLALSLLPACLFGQAGLKINEVSTDTIDWIEIVNLDATPVNMAGYKIRWGGNSGPSFVPGVYTIPAGVTLNQNQVLVITEDPSVATPTVPAGVFKAFCGATIVWQTTPTIGTNGVVALNDPFDFGLDRMKWGNPLQDLSVYGSPWTGAIAPGPGGSCMNRNVPTDSNTPSDWTWTSTPSATPGAINPGEANVIDIEFATTPGMGDLLISVTTFGPPVPGGEIFNLVSLIDSIPDASGPLFGIGADAFLQATTPLDPGNPFHTFLDGAGQLIIYAPPGILPLGLHLEAVSIYYAFGIQRISTVETITL
jgi:hypothetical protein